MLTNGGEVGGEDPGFQAFIENIASAATTTRIENGNPWNNVPAFSTGVVSSNPRNPFL